MQIKTIWQKAPNKFTDKIMKTDKTDKKNSQQPRTPRAVVGVPSSAHHHLKYCYSRSNIIDIKQNRQKKPFPPVGINPDTMQKKIAILPRLHSYNLDPLKQWFVFFSFRNPRNGKMKRFRVYNSLGKNIPVQQRIENARTIVNQYSQLLNEGWNPFIMPNAIYEKPNDSYNTIRKTNRLFANHAQAYINGLIDARPATITSYKSKFKVFNKFIIQQNLHLHDLAELPQMIAENFNNHLKKSLNLANKTINGYNILLKAFFKHINEANPDIQNPFRNTRKLKVETVPPLTFPAKMINDLMNAARQHDPQMALVMQLIYNCFIRPKEIRFLKILNIDFATAKITIPASIAKNKIQRSVDVPYHLLLQMQQVGLQRANPNLFVTSSSQQPGPRHVSKNYFYNRFLKLKKIAKIPKGFVLYAFKHTGMVELKKSGADWLDIKTQAGHQSIDQTIQYTLALMNEGSKHIRENSPKI